MAVNESGAGGAVTELLSGWSFVVHRPSEDPEPSSLPSTVDIAAFSAGPNDHQTPNSPSNHCSDSDSDSDSDNSGSEASQSCSASSSDSDSTSSSQYSSHDSSPQSFNLTSMQTGGLKLKIAAVRKSSERDDEDIDDVPEIIKKPAVRTRKRLSGSSSAESNCSDSESDSESHSTTKSDQSEIKTSNKSRISSKNNKNLNVNKNVVDVKNKKNARLARNNRTRSRFQRGNKSLSSSRVSSRDSTSNSEDGESESDTNKSMLASCSLQEIRQEDLAAILPDQQECDAFGGFECETRANKVLIHESDGSGSDIELTPQLVTEAIQRATEIPSDTEVNTAQPSHYSNSLLQHFEAQTQMLSTTPAHNALLSNNIMPAKSGYNSNSKVSSPIESKRKRGRPRKSNVTEGNVKHSHSKTSSIPLRQQEYSGEPNVSPDSGIQDSPEHVSSPEPNLITSTQKNKDPNFRSKVYSVSKEKLSDEQIKVKPEEKISKKKTVIKTEENAKPVNSLKQEKQKVPNQSLDRILFANTDRILYPPRRKVGRPSVKISQRRPGRPPKHKTISSPKRNSTEVNKVKSHTNEKRNKKSEKNLKSDSKINRKHKKTLSNNDLLQLNNLCIAKSSDNFKKIENVKDIYTKISNKKLKSFNEICDKVTNREVLSNAYNNHNLIHVGSNKPPLINKNHKHLKNSHLHRPSYLISKHKHHKHHKSHRHLHRPEKAVLADPKIVNEIDKLITDFVKYCNIGSNRLTHNKIPEIFKCVKRISKKRKGLDNLEGRKKKKLCNNLISNDSKEPTSNEQRLPLKKRHYHVSNGEHKPVNTSTSSADSSKTISDLDTSKTSPKILETKKNTNISTTHKGNNDKIKSSILKEVKPNISGLSIRAEEIFNSEEFNLNKSKNSKLFSTHIQEAIEACINKYASGDPQKNLSKIESEIAELKKMNSEKIPHTIQLKGITATTPKKRHKLETDNMKSNIIEVVRNLVELTTIKNNNTEIKVEELNEKIESKIPSLLTKNTPLENQCDDHNKNKKLTKTNETVAQIKTRKKYRLEDLTSNLASKLTPPTETLDVLPSNNQRKSNKKSNEEISSASHNRASVIKSPSIRRTKLASTEKLSELDGNIVSETPTGIFLPTIDIELHIPASTIRTTTGLSDKDEKEIKTETHNLRQKKSNDNSVNKPDNKTTDKNEIGKKKKETYTPINKNDQIVKANSKIIKNLSEKMKQNALELQKKRPRRRKAINRTGFPTVKKKKKKQSTTSNPEGDSKGLENVYERIPRIDEMPSNFVERTEKKLSAASKLEDKSTKALNSINTIIKSEIKKERGSASPVIMVPDINSKSVNNERPLSRLELKQEASLHRDSSPSNFELRPKRKLRESSTESKGKQSPASFLSEDIDSKNNSRNKKRKRDLSVESKLSDKIKRRRERSVERSVIDDEDSNSIKRRLRDLSPASSVDPLPSDKRIRSDDTSVSGDEIRKSRKPPRWRKKYLVAGLFSDYYKEDEPRKSEPILNKTKLMYKKEDHPHGLLPPPYHCGKWLRCRKTHFQLPYDLWWQHTHSRLPGRDIVPSWNYRKIRTNVYCVRPTTVCELQSCNCSESSGCGDDCINRLVLAECPASHRCKNQRIQRHDWAPGLDKFMTEDKGWGVRTKLPIKSGEFILEYVGEVVSDQEFKQRMASRYAHDTHHYCLHLDGGLVIDGHRMGGDGRFVNHSCQPNCEMQKWSVNGQFRMALFALRDIKANEELTYDYNFSLFNPADGQVCKCKSQNCRGVIGGKSQRVKPALNTNTSTNQESNSNNSNGRVGRPRKTQAKRTTSGSKDVTAEKTMPMISTISGTASILPQMRPLNNQQKAFVIDHHCFLLKNLNKIKKNRDRSASLVSRTSQIDNGNIGSTFFNHLNALRQPRNIRTRRLAQAEGDPELTKAARLAEIFRELWSLVANAKDEKNVLLSQSFMSLPSKRKLSDYYQKVNEPIDLTTIEQNIENGVYRTVELFENDMSRLFDNAIKYFGRTSDIGVAAIHLRKIYGQGKLESIAKLKEILGEKPPATFVTSKKAGGEEEDVIRCICGLYRDEGLMIQCERCLVWQHSECVKTGEDAPSFHCERCLPREIDYEIPLNEFTEHGHRYYLTLMRGDLQLRQGDSVYVLRDLPIEGTDKKHNYQTIGNIEFTELDIFRIERLWKDKDTGKRMAYGHHYLRPHETYHEPTRKFFPNEVMRVPLYEAVPVELIMRRCWVLDINTFCKGRPIDATEEHIYICEYRVDKSARLFSKVSSKSHYPICTKSYAFERFETRLKVSRTYAPHDVHQEITAVKPRGRRPQDGDTKVDIRPITLHVPIVRSREEKRTRLNEILLKLLAQLPTKQPLDVSYLLEAGRRRKKVQS